ncbi:dihydroorotase [Enhygromyxa salina]|uniref:Dihydroorotase n=1 Tax=Enhygromyxa salina TaxID=215803 RepID=A0A2S9Y4G7_9BACT|nr:dihydroorotase [Enhygromyxa salina]PRP99965.1 Dihydroorotase [Enhygromyxa salina]
MDSLTITQPDDWHLHLRDGDQLISVIADTAARFGRAVVMPNLKPPVVSVAQALGYRERILAARPPGSAFEPLMTLYLTADTTPAQIQQVAATPQVVGVKLYPAGATTNSEAGVTSLDALTPVFEAMAEHAVPLLIHGETTDPNDDVFDREARFVDGALTRLHGRHPELKIVLEHITTADAVAWIGETGPRTAATVTAHHLLLNRNAIFSGGLRPHHYCLPVLKRERHREALVEAATSVANTGKYFLGTDSAPHSIANKHSACGCAGIYTAHAAIELYAEVFEAAGALDRLEAFASFHGPDFYGLPRNRVMLNLVREAWTVPETLSLGDELLVPLRAGERVRWRIAAQPS